MFTSYELPCKLGVEAHSVKKKAVKHPKLFGFKYLHL